jgi:hypothetical protein
MKTFASLVIGCVFGVALAAGAIIVHDRLVPKPTVPVADPAPDSLTRFRIAILACESACGPIYPFDFTVGVDSIRCVCPRPAPIKVAKVPTGTKLAAEP